MSQLVRVARHTLRCDERLFSRPIVDLKRIKCVGGRGGDGAVVFSKHGPHRLVGPGLPVGGAGGKGGDVYVAPMDKHDHRADLRHIPGSIAAQNGSIGSSRASGRAGNDVVLKVPLGTLVYRFDHPADVDAQEPVANWRTACTDWKRTLIADINEVAHERVLLALGGRGGRGNTMRSPYEAEYGFGAQAAYYEIELKSIADVGLLGLPNVGKSTLLTALTRANSKIAAYPFTTMAPCIGHIRFKDGASISVADLPGIVECRLTQEFFRHIERTKILLYVIDVCSTAHGSIEDSFAALRCQVEAYGCGLADKPFAVVVTKMDVNAGDAPGAVDSFCRSLKAMGFSNAVVPTSAKLGLGVPGRSETQTPHVDEGLVRTIRGLVERFTADLASRAGDADGQTADGASTAAADALNSA